MFLEGIYSLIEVITVSLMALAVTLVVGMMGFKDPKGGGSPLAGLLWFAGTIVVMWLILEVKMASFYGDRQAAIAYSFATAKAFLTDGTNLMILKVVLTVGALIPLYMHGRIILAGLRGATDEAGQRQVGGWYLVFSLGFVAFFVWGVIFSGLNTHLHVLYVALNLAFFLPYSHLLFTERKSGLTHTRLSDSPGLKELFSLYLAVLAPLALGGLALLLAYGGIQSYDYLLGNNVSWVAKLLYLLASLAFVAMMLFFIGVLLMKPLLFFKHVAHVVIIHSNPVDRLRFALQYGFGTLLVVGYLFAFSFAWLVVLGFVALMIPAAGMTDGFKLRKLRFIGQTWRAMDEWYWEARGRQKP